MLTPSPVNVLKGRMWDDESVFDQETDKSKFRDYDATCDPVKEFYKEQHGLYFSLVARVTADFERRTTWGLSKGRKIAIDFVERSRIVHAFGERTC